MPVQPRIATAPTPSSGRARRAFRSHASCRAVRARSRRSSNQNDVLPTTMAFYVDASRVGRYVQLRRRTSLDKGEFVRVFNRVGVLAVATAIGSVGLVLPAAQSASAAPKP